MKEFSVKAELDDTQAYILKRSLILMVLITFTNLAVQKHLYECIREIFHHKHTLLQLDPGVPKRVTILRQSDVFLYTLASTSSSQGLLYPSKHTGTMSNGKFMCADTKCETKDAQIDNHKCYKNQFQTQTIFRDPTYNNLWGFQRISSLQDQVR